VQLAFRAKSLVVSMLGIFRVVCLILVVLLPGTERAQTQDFYSGKTLTVIAGFPPGGGVDGEMRVLTKYLGKYIPGQPAIIARNMPGAGGIVLANHLYTFVAPDGLTLAMPGRSGFLLSNVVHQKRIRYDLTRFSYVGSAGSAVNALWLHRRTGIRSLADLRRAKKTIVIGALNPRSENAIAPKVLAKYEGWPLKVVTGYPGFGEVMIAIERGEVDGLFSHEGSVANLRPDIIASGTIKAIVQSSAFYPNVPVLADVVRNAKAKALLSLVTAPSHIGLPLLGPPGMPADRLAILRKSYWQVMDDKAYRAEAARRGLPVERAIRGAELQKIIAESLSGVPEPIVKEYMAFSGVKPK
jgi:tripartite-type tricarboxylate transporter receptor subunit TctC